MGAKLRLALYRLGHTAAFAVAISLAAAIVTYLIIQIAA
jgi:hypothetical protein